MSHAAPSIPVLTQRHPLDAVPAVASGVESTPSGIGGKGIVVRIERFPFGPRIATVAKKLGMRHFVSFELDERGAFFWDQIDGDRPLTQIAQSICDRFAISEQQARLLTVQYTRELMLRGLITLRVDAPAAVAAPAAGTQPHALQEH